jgi:Ribosomal protein L19e
VRCIASHVFSTARIRYHELYLKTKGNTFRNKLHLMEHIHKAQAEHKADVAASAKSELRREKNKVQRARRAQQASSEERLRQKFAVAAGLKITEEKKQ